MPKVLGTQFGRAIRLVTSSASGNAIDFLRITLDSMLEERFGPALDSAYGTVQGIPMLSKGKKDELISNKSSP